MKKKKLLKAIIPSLVAILAAGGVVVGATYALFTSSAKADVSVTAGKVNASAVVSGINLYSASLTDDDSTGKVLPGSHDLGQFSADYYHVKQTGKFSNGGTATLNQGDLTISAMTPGDRVDAQFVVTNNSNVQVKYRFVAECTDTAEESLRFFSALEFTALGQTKTNVRKYSTSWQVWDIPTTAEEKVKSSDIKIAMPITMGDEFQEAVAHISLSVEMVQANAFTADSADEILVFKAKEVPESTETPSGMEDVVLKAGGTEAQPLVKVEVPTGTTGEVKADGTPVAAGDTLNLSVVENENATSVIVEAGEEAKLFDVTLVNQENKKIESTNTKLKVSIYVGENKTILHVYHKDHEVPLYDGTNEGYKYENGYVVYYTASFSPFAVVYEMMFAGGSGTAEDPYQINTPTQLANAKLKNAFFRLTADIDLSEEDIKTSGNTYGFACPIGQLYNSTLDGANHEIKLSLDDESAESMFGDIINSTLKNVTVVSSAPLAGFAYNMILDKVSFTGIGTYHFTNNSGCLAYYCYGAITTTDVDVTANVIGTLYNGAFFGYNMDISTLTMSNCTYSGTFISSQAGVIIGNPRYKTTVYNLTNVKNNGIIQHTNKDYSKSLELGAVNDDGQGSKATVIKDGVTYTYDSSKGTYVNGSEVLSFNGTGQYIGGVIDSGLVITVNADKTFNFTASKVQGVSYYHFEIITNVRNIGPDGGSGNISVMDTITEDGSASYNTALKQYYFADGTEATSYIGTHPIIEIEGVNYYMNTDPYLKADVGGRGCYIVLRAYDANGVLLSSGGFVY